MPGEGHSLWSVAARRLFLMSLFRQDGPAVPLEASRRPQEPWSRAWLEAFQRVAALLVPLASLASQSINEASVGNVWQLIALGFASDTLENILAGRPESPAAKQLTTG